MKRLTISTALFLFFIGMVTPIFAQTPFSGTWVQTTITEDNVSEDIYYAFPSKITFGEEPICILYYPNNKEKEALYHIIPEKNSIYFSIKGNGAIPEKQFYLEWNQEDPESIQLKYTKMAGTPQEEQYIYNYQLQN